jgi:DNA-binding NtrC family response regulator
MTTIIEWNEAALNVAVRRLTDLLRTQFEVRVGLLTSNGAYIDLCRGERFRARGLFDQYCDAVTPWSTGSLLVSFGGDLRRWHPQLMESVDGVEPGPSTGPAVRLESGAGFEAVAVPVRGADGSCAGAVICSGFVSAEGAADALDRIRSLLPEEVAATLERAEGPTVPQLQREQRRFLEMLTRAIAEEVFEGLQRAGTQDGSERSEAMEFHGMLGGSGPMQRLFGLIARVARTNSTVLIEGENGTGKELVARAIHRASLRRDQPFLAVNCAALPGELIASELFGHVKGAFSGAHRERVGLFEAADGGTLLLDEIGDMDIGLQVKLLRILQEGTFNRVGDHQPRKVNVRVLCATNRDLQQLVGQGKFREDLYYRIKVIQLAIPPLRQRGQDLSLLIDFFLARTAQKQGKGPRRLSSDCRQQMLRYAWPGNVRELENEIERLVILSGDEEEISTQALSPRIRREAENPDPFAGLTGFNLPEAVEYLERTMILEGLKRTGWNKTQTARELGVSRRNLIRKVAYYGLEDDVPQPH